MKIGENVALGLSSLMVVLIATTKRDRKWIDLDIYVCQKTTIHHSQQTIYFECARYIILKMPCRLSSMFLEYVL